MSPAPAALPPRSIRLRGVRHHNLKNFDLELPLGKLTVVTGLSGSGKSTLAFDTLFAEGQRRYIETFSPYARQFFDRMDKPQVDRVEGIPPAIAIEQRNTVKTTRSTVGTMTEICDYLKVLWPHLAQLHCRSCRKLVRKDSPDLVWETVRNATAPKPADASEPDEVLVTFDLPLSEKLGWQESLQLIAKQGYQRLLLDGTPVRLEDAVTQPSPHPRQLTVIQDRLRPVPENRARFIEACEQAFHFGKDRLTVHPLHASRLTPHASLPFSRALHCPTCDLSYREPSPALFSFNNPVGACPKCRGFGRVIGIDYNLAVPDRTKTLAGGLVKPWQTGVSANCQADLLRFCRAQRIPVNVPFHELPAGTQRLVIEGEPDYGTDDEHEWPRAWYGVRGYFRWLESQAYKMHFRVLLSRYRSYTTCPDCHGQRLQPEALLYKVSGIRGQGSGRAASGGHATHLTPDTCHLTPAPALNLADFYALSVRDALGVIGQLADRHTAQLTQHSPLAIALGEVRSRLQYLADVGLGYLTLDRPTRTLSGGETERVNLTTCLGTRLVNTLYVLDEPSVGLHPRDTDRLIRILHALRDTGNTVIVVEHEASVIRAADNIVDIGPGHGEAGGEVVFHGPVKDLLGAENSLTGQYLSGRKNIEPPERRPVVLTNASQADGIHPGPAPTPCLTVSGASLHNLRNLTATIPLGRFVVLTGVSGSGKTTLAREVLFPTLEENLKSQISNLRSAAETADADDPTNQEPETRNQKLAVLAGHEHLARVVLVDQSPLGKTPRSNPAVYIGAFDHIRDFFAESDVARQRGLAPGDFSFNAGQGRCERCRGAGFEKIEMQFLSDVFITCPDCAGRRYRPHILEIKLEAGQESGVRSQESGKLPRPTYLTRRTSHLAPAKSIADLLEAPVDDAIAFLATFADSKPAGRAVAALKLLQEVGLGYLRLGQPINTLSGGESQRLKLVAFLAEHAASTAGESSSETPATASAPPRSGSPPTFFIFDEPTTGLHFDDVRMLLAVFQRLVNAGHSLLVIEHNLEVIRSADWVIDLGPDAGADGGELVVAGTPEDVAACEQSHTGKALRDAMQLASASRAPAHAPRITHHAPPELAGETPALLDVISIHGAREHNLKNLSLEIPRGKFVVVTGVSGSGKSTLAFDLLFAEGQRRFLDAMGTYARQFIEQLARPDVDLITGIPPTVSIEQRTTRGGGKSTVATVTEVYHFLRLLFARLGTQHCPDCGCAVTGQTRDALAQQLAAEVKKRGELTLLAPVVKNRKGFHSDVAQWAAKHGYEELRADGKIHRTDETFRLDRFREHDVEVVTGILARSGKATSRGRVNSKSSSSGRTTSPAEELLKPQQLIDETLDLGKGTLFALDRAGTVTVHSTERACPSCGRSFQPLDPKMFSYNSSQGWCPKCRGFGELFYLPDVERGANADAIEESWWGWQEGKRESCPECHGARLNPVARAVRLEIPAQKGRRASTEVAPSIDDFAELPVGEAFAFFSELKFAGSAAQIARDILPEIRERLRFLDEVGLGYLQLGRGVTTLSGGEAQRIRLAAQLGSNLSGVLYVLDEPTIGLHARDNEQLLASLHQLQSRGNSLLVVEHDEETMRRADWVIDLGPGAGAHGGEVVASGTLAELLRHDDSITGQCLRAQATKTHPARGERRPVGVTPATTSRAKSGKASRSTHRGHTDDTSPVWLTLANAAVNNLKHLTIRFPLNRFVVVTGVSGSGKSTLIRECLLPAVQAALNRKSKTRNQKLAELSGYQSLESVHEVDQGPIGRTPRSTPATYVGFFDDIRALFANAPEARMRGYTGSRFSFNSHQGRCPACEGAGVIKLEMNFLPPAFVRCDTCGGTRFNRETLDIEWRGKNIAHVLDLSVDEAIEFFAAQSKIRRPLEALRDTGLGYLRLGQTSPTLSGGEAQRVKLVTHLLSGLKEESAIRGQGPSSKDQVSGQTALLLQDVPRLPETSHLTPRTVGPRTRAIRPKLFILEEPTIGLHMADVSRLVEVLQRLVDTGHSVIVIEHNLDLIAEADWVIDLGPEAGDGGGQLVVEGPPEIIAKARGSHTGRFLRTVLRGGS